MTRTGEAMTDEQLAELCNMMVAGIKVPDEGDEVEASAEVAAKAAMLIADHGRGETAIKALEYEVRVRKVAQEMIRIAMEAGTPA
jgi:hypothetical protein